MPEAAIGLLPDMGASHFLSRLPGYFGEYLGLTGTQLGGAEMVACELATHFVMSKVPCFRIREVLILTLFVEISHL